MHRVPLPRGTGRIPVHQTLISVIGTNWLLRGDSEKRERLEDEFIMSRT